MGLWMVYWVFISAGGLRCFIGPSSFSLGPRDGPANGPISCPPSPCVRTAWTRAVIVLASFAISTCLFELSLIAVISRMLIMIFGFRARLSVLTTSSVLRPSGPLTFYLFGDFALRSLPNLRWVLGFSRVFFVYPVCFCDGLESLFIFAYLC